MLTDEEIKQVAELEKERDEADRRAGAAERAYKTYLDAAVARDSWLRKAKAQWGADSSISFDVVWSEALALKEQITTLTADLALAKHNNEAHDRELERVIAERDKATQYWQIAEGRCDALQERIDSLLTTGNAVVERWDSPLWKDLPHTGEFIHALREAITKAEGRCDALQKDADRYRFLRMHTDWFDWDIVVQPHLPADHPAHDYFEVKIDCAIDFVMGNLK